MISAVALLLGAAIALVFGNPFTSQTKKLTPLLLQISIVGLGAAMDLKVIGRVGLSGLSYTLIGITFTLAAGILLGNFLRVPRDTSLLISVGTAICGGSAIAAVAPAIRATNEATSAALATVFLLNALALLFFAPVGRAFGLDETQFGLFSALAVHDTSSVVGTSLQYGPQAVLVATTVKLARALWIVPVTFAAGYFWRRGQAAESKQKYPYFIIGFLAAAALVTYLPELQGAGQTVAAAAKWLLIFTLFLIGLGLNREVLLKVGFKPFVQGVLLWLLVSASTLAAILFGFIRLI